MKKKNLIVLDIDDTLTKSEEIHTDSLLYAMKHFGVENIDTDWRNYANATDSYIFSVNYEKQLGKKFDFSIIDEFEQVMNERFLSLTNTSELPGASKMVDFFLEETDYAVCFATGSIYKPAIAKLEQTDINYKPEILTASNHIFTREGIIEASIEKAKVYFDVEEFDHIISFGDGLWDVTTAKNLDLHFVGVNDKNSEDFKKMNVQYHISDWTKFDLKKVEEIFKIR